MYDYIPKRKNKKAATYTALFSGLAAIAFLCGGYLGDYRYIAELAAVFSMAVAILLAGRYLLKDYVYSLKETEDGVDFIVVEVQGKRRSVVCRIGVEEIRETVKETSETREAVAARLKGVKKYDYCLDISPESALCVFFDDRGNETAVRFMPDEKMEGLILSLLAAAPRSDHDGSEERPEETEETGETDAE